MDVESRRQLQVLEAIAANQRTTQRGLARELGIALGLTNLYLKRLARKGYVKCVNVQSNRVLYLITPKGIAEKARLTYEYMQYSLQLYSRVRSHLRSVLTPLAAAGRPRVAIYGTGEAAELAFLSVREAELELTAVFDDEGGGRFLGMSVESIRDHSRVSFDLLLIARLGPPEAAVERLIKCGIQPAKLQTLRP